MPGMSVKEPYIALGVAAVAGRLRLGLLHEEEQGDGQGRHSYRKAGGLI